MFRTVTKVVNDGRCTVTLTVTETSHTVRDWEFHGVQIETTRNPLALPDDYEPKKLPALDGDLREECHPSFAEMSPSLCGSVLPETKLIECSAVAAQLAPEGCEGAHIVGEVPVDYETPQEKGDRLIENMKKYDEACKTDPTLTCGDYPFHEWEKP